MTHTTVSVRGVVKTLIHACRDGEEGFKTAADAIHAPELKSELMQYSHQRGEFAAELERALLEFGEDTHTGGSLSGAIHRGWIQLTKAVTDNQHAVLSACERGEDSAVQAYEEAVSSPLPPEIGAAVSVQFDAIKRVHNRIRSLRDAARRD